MNAILRQIGLVIGFLGIIALTQTSAYAGKNSDPLNQGVPGFLTAPPGKSKNDTVLANATRSIAQGRDTFRFNTFGDDTFWSDLLRLNEAIAGAVNGGVGPGLAPTQALALGLK